MIVVPEQRRQDYRAQGWWGEATLADHFLARVQQHPHALAACDPPNKLDLVGRPAMQWTWAQMQDKVASLVAVFASHGLKKDDVIVVQLSNCLELHALYVACAFTGVILSPLPLQYRAHEFRQIMQLLQAKWVIAETSVGGHAGAQSWEVCRAEFSCIEQIWTADALNTLWAATPALTGVQLREHLERVQINADDVLTVCWTSGTEAAPKGVPRSHNEWLIVGQSIIDAGQLQPQARMLIPFPFVNMAGVSTSLAAWIMLGASLHHHHPFSLSVFIEQLRQHAFDYTVAAPAVLIQLLKDPESLQGIDRTRLQRIGCGGAAVPDWVVRQLAERFGIELVNYYGSNEGAALSATPQDIPDATLRSQYFPRFGVRGFAWSESWSASNSRKICTRLVSLQTEKDIREAGEIGELRFSGPTIFSTYFRRPDLTANAFDAQGFYKTGDLFEIAGDQLQYYRFCGRQKDIVIRAGMNISSEEIESVLTAHPKILEAAVIGVPDEALGERVCAVLVSREGETLTLAQLHQHLQQEVGIARYKWPEHLRFVSSLPRNPLGKILKRELRARFQTNQLNEVTP